MTSNEAVEESKSIRLLTYQVERQDLTGTFGYMCTLFGIEAGFIGTALILLPQIEIAQWVLVLIPLPFVAVGTLLFQSWAVLVVHGSYARYLERKLTQNLTVDAPLGVNMTEFVYSGKELLEGNLGASRRYLSWAFGPLSFFPILGSFLALATLVGECIALLDWTWVKLLMGLGYGLISGCLVAATLSIRRYRFDWEPPKSPPDSAESP